MVLLRKEVLPTLGRQRVAGKMGRISGQCVVFSLYTICSRHLHAPRGLHWKMEMYGKGCWEVLRDVYCVWLCAVDGDY